MTESIKELAVALAKAQSEIEPAPMSGVNPFFKNERHPKGSPYSTLGDIFSVIRKPLADHGLALIQSVEILDVTQIVLKTTLIHASGQTWSSTYPVNPVKTDPQSLGSALSYARRYSIATLLGVVSDEDDDGNAASDPRASSHVSGASKSASGSSKSGEAPPKTGGTSDAQIKRLFAIGKPHGWAENTLKAAVRNKWGIESLHALSRAQYDELCDHVAKNRPSALPSVPIPMPKEPEAGGAPTDLFEEDLPF